MTTPVIGIAYVDGPRLIRSVVAAATWVDAAREELNRINVFPVPDGDTGTNFALTLRSVADALTRLEDERLPSVTRTMAESCVFAAHGNSGLLLSHFLIGFKESLGERISARVQDIAAAFRRGADKVLEALDNPVEGTILTVCRDTADAAAAHASRTKNLAEFMKRVLEDARRSLGRTPDLLDTLKDAGVVDAGGLGFVRLIEGVVRLIEGDPLLEAPRRTEEELPFAAAREEVAEESDYQYCTEVLVRGEALPSTTSVRTRLRELGASIVVLATGDLLKVHVHTNDPDAVFALGASWGSIEQTKAEDMREQHEHLASRQLTIVVDSSSDLPDEIVDKHSMVVCPIQVISGGRSYNDRVDISGEEIYRRMEAGEVFTTSQPTPAAFLQCFRDALEDANEVVGVILASALSGTFGAAQAARKSLGNEDISLVDSRSASLGLGMLAIRAAELAELGWSSRDIAQELERIRNQSGALFTVDRFDNLLRSGRVSRGKAWLGGLLDIKPILEIGPDGRVVPLDRVRGREALIPRVIQHIERRLTPGPDKLRIGIVHANAPGAAQRLESELTRRFNPQQVLTAPITAAIGVHTGPGAFGVFYQVED